MYIEIYKEIEREGSAPAVTQAALPLSAACELESPGGQEWSSEA